MCLAAPYARRGPGPSSWRSGRIAAFAHGPDYHDAIGQRVQVLWTFLREQVPGARGRCYVDTGPVLERDFAQQAGLGWCGKNTCLIDARAGSYLLLAEIVTDAELACSEPAEPRCGTCTACLQACPTQALVAPHVLDARRCIAYLTIENRGPIPRALRPLLGQWIFGCDACQEACLWNRRRRPPAPDPAPGNADLEQADLVELLALDAEGFRRRFRGTAILRARRRGLARNVAVALGNCGDLAAVPALERALTDPDPLVRGHAAWALGHLAGEQARAPLLAARQRESEASVREEIDLALAELHP